MSSSAKFIVTFKDSATPEQVDQFIRQAKDQGSQISTEYNNAIMKGFAGTLSPAQLQSFQGDDIIDYIEPDSVITTQ